MKRAAVAAAVAIAFADSSIVVLALPELYGRLHTSTRSPARGEEAAERAGALRANACLALLFGALVGALFLAVLLVISVWNYSPIGGALVVSALPVAALAVRPLRAPVAAGAALLALGLIALALLPSASVWLLASALALCGAGLGLALPDLSNAALPSGTLTVGARHLGLVLALAVIAPLLASNVPAAGDRALLKGTAVLLDAPIGIDKKVPVALDLRGAFARARAGETPDLAQPFDAHGAQHDSSLAAARDKLVGTIEATITRASRPAFLVCAGFAALALLLVVVVAV